MIKVLNAFTARGEAFGKILCSIGRALPVLHHVRMGARLGWSSYGEIDKCVMRKRCNLLLLFILTPVELWAQTDGKFIDDGGWETRSPATVLRLVALTSLLTRACLSYQSYSSNRWKIVDVDHGQE